MKKLAAVLVACLAGCSASTADIETATQNLVASRLKDPESARFSNVKFMERSSSGGKHEGPVCGEVNARNALGGYVGATRFIAYVTYTSAADVKLQQLVRDNEEDAMQEAFADLWAANCR